MSPESPRKGYVLCRINFEYNDSTYDEEGTVPTRVFLNRERAREARQAAEKEKLCYLARNDLNPFDYGEYYDWSEVVYLEPPIWCDYLKENGIEPPEGVQGWGPMASFHNLSYRLGEWYDENHDSWSPEQVFAILQTVAIAHYRILEVDLDELT